MLGFAYRCPDTIMYTQTGLIQLSTAMPRDKKLIFNKLKYNPAYELCDNVRLQSYERTVSL